ncbi:MAG: NfeD family protein [Spirochaetaceae bacterium]
MIESISPVTLWLIVGIVFIILEMFLPGFIIGFFGIGAIITCLTTLIGITPNFTSQMITFFIVSVVLLLLFQKVLKRKLFGIKEETTNFNIQIGKIVPVTEFIDPTEGTGKVKYQGAIWSASSEDKIAPGEKARLVGCDNLTLIVKKGKEEK